MYTQTELKEIGVEVGAIYLAIENGFHLWQACSHLGKKS